VDLRGGGAARADLRGGGAATTHVARRSDGGKACGLSRLNRWALEAGSINGPGFKFFNLFSAPKI
jgi:hypothetical protein